MLRDRTANWVILVVTSVWVANFVATLIERDYDGTTINAIFATLVGGTFAIKGRRNTLKDADEQQKKEEAKE